MKFDLEPLRLIEFPPDKVVACRFYNPYFSTSFLETVRDELLKKALVVSIGIDTLTPSEMLALELFDDLLDGRLLNKEDKT